MAKLSAPNAGAKNAKKSVKFKKVQDQQVEAHLINADARHDASDANASGASTPHLSMGANFSFAAAADGAAGAAAPAAASSGSSFPILPVLGGVAVAGGVAAFALGGGGEKNVAPTLAAVPDVAGKEDTASSITLSGADANKSDVLTYSAGTAANGTVSVSGNVVTYTPKANFNGTDTFTVTVTDKAGLTATQTVKVNVAAVNDAPAFAAATQAVSTDEDKSVDVTLAATDVDGDALTYTSSLPAKGTVAIVGNKLTYIPGKDFNGSDTFVVTAKDAGGLTATQTINVTVKAVNDAPAFASATLAVTADEEVAKTFTVSATDVDGDTLTYTVGSATNGTVSISGNTVTYTSKADYNGSDSFVVTAKDPSGLTATQTVNITVAPVAAESRSIDVGTAAAAVTIDASKDAGGNSPADWSLNDDSSKETNVIVTNFAKGDVINVTGSSADYKFTSVGNDVVIVYNNVNASVVNKIVLAGVAGTGFIFDEDSAEKVLGWNFFNAGVLPNGTGVKDAAGLAAGNLDADDDANVLTVAVVDASKSAIAFKEDGNIANTVKITGFSKDDSIAISNASLANYKFQGIGTDVFMTYNKDGVVSQINLAGVNPSGAVISSYSDVQTLIGADFLKTATVSAPANSQSIDNGTATAPKTYDASTSAINFTDNAAVETNVKVTGFGSDDRITVTGATSGQYQFTTVDTDGNGKADLVITFNNTAASVVNSITLLEAVSANAFVADYATAQKAMNNPNFMVFG